MRLTVEQSERERQRQRHMERELTLPVRSYPFDEDLTAGETRTALRSKEIKVVFGAVMIEPNADPSYLRIAKSVILESLEFTLDADWTLNVRCRSNEPDALYIN